MDVLTLKLSKNYTDTKSASFNGTPKGVYATTTALNSDFPTGNAGIYVVAADGKWYFWNGSAWEAGGNYQATQTMAILNVDYFPTINSTELIVNPDFEIWSGASPTSWTTQLTYGTITKDTTTQHGGSNAVKITHGNSTNWYEARIIQDVSVTSSLKATLKFWTKGDGTNAGSYAIYDNTNAHYIVDNISTSVTSANWSLVTKQITIPAGCTSIKLSLCAPALNTAFAEYDDVSFITTDTSNKNGISVPLQTIIDYFTATATNNMTLNSDYNPSVYGTELSVNSDFENWSSTTPDNWSSRLQNGSTLTKDTSTPHSGSNSAKLTHGTSTHWYDAEIYQDIVVTPNKLYELNFWTKGDGTNYGAFAIYDNTHSAYLITDEKGSIIGGSISTQITTTTWTKFSQRFTPPSGCTSVRITLSVATVTNAYAEFDNISLKTLDVSDKNGTSVSLQSILECFANSPKTHLYNQNLVCFGDSITGMFVPPTDYPTIIANNTGLNVTNAGFGGCKMSRHFDTVNYDPFSMYRLADAIATGNWTLQDTAVAGSVVPSYFAGKLASLKVIDWTKIDLMTIAYGTNDWADSIPLTSSDPLDCTTYIGAARYSLSKIMQTYPNIKILLVSPIYRYFTGDVPTDDSDTKTNTNNAKLHDFVNSLINLGTEIHIPVANVYDTLGVNQYNWLTFFYSNDGTHPNATGRKRLGIKIADKLLSEY